MKEHVPVNTAKPSAKVQKKPFFEKEGDKSFFDSEKENSKEDSFFQSAQTKLEVGAPNDPLESQADNIAEKVVRKIQKPPTVQTKEEDTGRSDEGIQQKPLASQITKINSSSKPKALKKEMAGTGKVGSKGTQQIQNKRGSGSPLSGDTRKQMESGFGTKLGDVKLHTDNAAVRMNKQLNAKAFTVGNDIFFNQGQYNPGSQGGQKLLAHELTHTLQQTGGSQAQRMPIGEGEGDLLQRLPDFITDELASYARYIPGYTLFTVVIGFNPLTGNDVTRNATNVIDGLLGLIPPWGPILFSELQSRGLLSRAFEWLDAQLSRLDLSINTLENLIEDIWDDVDLLEGFDYNLNVAIRHFRSLLNRVIEFVGSLTDQLLEMVKEALVSALEPIIDEIPGYNLLTKIIGSDPIRGVPVDATMLEILEEFMILIGKETELEQMRERGTLQETADWLEENVTRFRGLLSQLEGIFTRVWEAISLESLADPIGTITEVATEFTSFVQDLIDFGIDVAVKVLELIKKALLGWLSEFANDIPGFHLVTVILGKNPFTEEVVPRTVVNIIRGFMSLMPGGEAQFQQMQETGAISQAAARIEAAMETLGITWEFIVNLFTSLWESLSIDDLIDPIGAFQRIVDTFAEPISRLFEFIFTVIKEIIQILLVIMNFPTDIIAQIIENAMSAYEDIKRDPIGFLKNLLRAVKQGFSKFFDNIITHLLNGVTDWLFGQLDDLGIQRPPDFSLGSILDLVFQILGLTVDRIWQKLAEKIGQEKVDRIRGMLDRLEGIWTFVTDVMERGPIAIWEYIQEQLTNLWDTVIGAIRDWIMTRIIEQVVTKLLSMLDPTGIMAVVNSFIAFYKAVQSFIEYLREMLEIVNSFVAGVAEIARGSVETAANFLEGALADGLPIAIGFLANQVGLGRIAEKIAEMIGSVREMIDRALDWLIDKAISLGGAVLQMGRDAVSALQEWWATRKEFTTDDGENHSIYFEGTGASIRLIVRSEPEGLEHLITRRRTELNTDPAGNAAKLAALTQAETIKGQMDALISSHTAGQGASAETSSIQTQINGFLDQIKAQLIIAGISGANANLPVSNVTWQMSNGRASWIEASPLTHLPGNTRGSHRQSSVSILGWEDAYLPPAVRSNYWVKAHLLNADLHGPAANFNLVPGTKETNNNQKTEIELPAKQAVAAKDGRVFYYEVTVDYWPSETGNEHYQYFPQSIYMSWGEMQGSPGAYTKKSGTDQSRTFFQDKPEQQSVAIAAFNESSAGKIRDTSKDAGFDLGPTVSGEIVNARRVQPHHSFGSDIENLIAVMDAHYVANKNKAAGWFTTNFGPKLRTLAASHIFMDF